jgi:hypothetical protein
MRTEIGSASCWQSRHRPVAMYACVIDTFIEDFLSIRRGEKAKSQRAAFSCACSQLHFHSWSMLQQRSWDLLIPIPYRVFTWDCCPDSARRIRRRTIRRNCVNQSHCLDYWMIPELQWLWERGRELNTLIRTWCRFVINSFEIEWSAKHREWGISILKKNWLTWNTTHALYHIYEALSISVRRSAKNPHATSLL